jgi:hypothetical protein
MSAGLKTDAFMCPSPKIRSFHYKDDQPQLFMCKFIYVMAVHKILIISQFHRLEMRIYYTLSRESLLGFLAFNLSHACGKKNLQQSLI